MLVKIIMELRIWSSRLVSLIWLRLTDWSLHQVLYHIFSQSEESKSSSSETVPT